MRFRAYRGLMVLLLGAVALAGLSAVIGSKMASPAQVAADARPPKPSIPRVRVRFAVLKATIALRADVTESSPVSIGVPASIGNADPVVTEMRVRRGSLVKEGASVMSVAERPVFVLEGAIPAFRDMKPGVEGVDVRQLQNALRRLGLYEGGDPAGVFGAATGSAVERLYAGAGHSPVGAGVAHGEVVFVRSLPQRVLGVAVPVGGIVGRDRSAGGVQGSAPGSVVTIGSGRVVLRGAVDPVSASGLHVGMSGAAVSEVLGKSFRVRVRSVGGAATADATTGVRDIAVTLVPTAPADHALLGQNVGVTLTTKSTGTKRLIVPIAAVVTRADGTSVVTVVDERGRTRRVGVEVGLVDNGEVAVTPLPGSALSVSDSVAVGELPR